MTLAFLVRNEEANAILGWIFTAVLALVAIERFLTGSYLWGGLALIIVALVSVPPVTVGDPLAIVHWPLLLIAALALVLRVVEVWPDVTGFLAISATALLFVVELDVFTEVELSHRFAVLFAMLTTMALQALWTIAQFFSDRWLGTAYLRSQTELQWDFIYVTAVGFALGALTVVYLWQIEPVGSFDRSPSMSTRNEPR